MADFRDPLTFYKPLGDRQDRGTAARRRIYGVQ